MGDADDDDLALHRAIPAKERLDTILSAEHLTTQQAVDALTASVVEGQAAYPHVIVATVSDEVLEWLEVKPEDLRHYREYVGPFADRRAAEAWAAKHYSDKPDVTWTAVQVRRPEWVEEDVARLRGIIDQD